MKRICALTIFLLYTNQSHGMYTETDPLLDNKRITERHAAQLDGFRDDFLKQQAALRASDQHPAHYTITVTVHTGQQSETAINPTAMAQLPAQLPAPFVITPNQLRSEYDPTEDDRLHRERRNQAEDAAQRRNCKIGCCLACILITTAIGTCMIVNEIEKHKVW